MLEAFPTTVIKKCLIYRKSTFSNLFYSIFFIHNSIIHCLLVSNTLEIQSRTRSTLPQSQHSKSLLDIITLNHSKKYNPFIYIYISISNRKTVLVFNIGYNLLNLSLRLFQTTLTLSLTFRIIYLQNCFCNKKIQNISRF